MSLQMMREIVANNADLADASLRRVRAADLLAACDELPVEKIDKKAKEIRTGPANVLRELSSDEKREAQVVFVPLASIRHLVKLAG